MAANIAKIINDGEDGQPWASAVSEKEIVVRIPPGEQQYPAGFVSRLQQLPLPLVSAEARVVINERTGTIIITGDVEISPVVISHKGMTISTILPTPVPTARTPVIKTTDVVGLDPGNVGGAKLQDLINAMDQLKVPVQDRIDIVKELHKSSKLHAKLITE
jgi:flagellar P-ring protein precursor FlgI